MCEGVLLHTKDLANVGPDRDSAMRVKPMRITFPLFIVPFSLFTTLDEAYNRNDVVSIRRHPK